MKQKQKQIRPTKKIIEPDPEIAVRKAKMDTDIDDLLDEIDGVLESDAQEFVRGFVQKGGQ